MKLVLTSAIVITVIIATSSSSSSGYLTKNSNLNEHLHGNRNKRSIFSLGMAFISFMNGGHSIFGKLSKCYNQVSLQRETQIVMSFIGDLFRGDQILLRILDSSMNDYTRSRMLDMLENAKRLNEIFFECYMEEINRMEREEDPKLPDNLTNPIILRPITIENIEKQEK